MAYRVKIGANLEKDIRRLLMAQIGRAVAQLSSTADTGTAIHETRKCLKRCRSLLRLARPGLGRRVSQAEDHALRAIARVLSAERDRQVMAQTVAKLAAGPCSEDEKAALALVAPLFASTGGNGLAHDDDQGDVRLALSMLKGADQSARQLVISRGRIAILARGFADTYGEARRAFKAAYRSGEDDDFHTLRKAIQHHWRHLQLLSPAWPELMDVRVASARHVAQLLGEDHDLSVLADYLADDRALGIGEGARETVSRLARVEQARLRTEVQPLAGRLLAQSPRDMEHLVVKLWPAAVKLVAQLRAAAKPAAFPADEVISLTPDA